MSLKPTKIYPFAIGAYEALPLLVQGSYFKILSATGMVDVTGDTFGTVEALQAGQGLRGQDFGRLVVRDRSGGSNMVRLLIGDDQFIDDRISGEVAVIDGNKSRSIAGGALAWRPQTSVTVQGNHAFAQIWNPAGSGRRAVVDAMSVNNSVTGDVFYGLTTVQLANVAVDRVVSVSSVNVPDTVMVGRVQESANYLENMAVAGSVYLQQWVTNRVEFARPFIVMPGCGFVIGSAGTDVCTVNGSIEFFEEAML